MVNTLYLPELREMLQQSNAEEMREFCSAIHPGQAAEFMEGLTAEETWRVLQHADLPTRVEVFSFLDRAKQREIVATQDRDQVAELIEHLSPDDRVDILADVEQQVVDDLLRRISPEDRRNILRLSAYPEDTAGAIMTTEMAKLPEHLTVRQALEEVARQAEELETIYYLYVVDDQEHLRGLVSARHLLSSLGRPDRPLGDLMETELITANVMDDQERVAQLVARYDLLAIPVVDDQYRLVGIVTHDDIIDVVREEATEDAHRMGGVTPIEENFLQAPFLMVWRRRAGWLSVLFVSQLLTFTAMAHFEGAIAAIVALSFFVPLCISTGGNSGSQAATLVTRALALRQIEPADWLRLMRHELLMGLALGVALGAIGFVRAVLTPSAALGDADRWLLAVVIALSVAVICVWGTLVGSLLPLLFRRLGLDPGFASAPFVSTLVDVTGIVIYFSIAQALLL